MAKRLGLSSVLFILILVSCNLPKAHPQAPSPEPLVTAALTDQPFEGPGVKILAPSLSGEWAAETSLVVQFVTAGGPFFEADLMVDGTHVDTLILDQSIPNPEGTLTWQQPLGGVHTLEVDVFTLNKDFYSSSIQITVSGAAQTLIPETAVAPTVDPEQETVNAQLLAIMRDTYHIELQYPAMMRKYRDGVPHDPWVSLAYVGDWLYDVEITPDQVILMPHPVGIQNTGTVTVSGGEKVLPVCRPSGSLKILVVMLDFQNLELTQAETLAALQTMQDDINEQMAAYSTAGGAPSPILQLELVGKFISPPTTLKDHELTPEIIKNVTGIDPTAYDLIVQVDMDGNETLRKEMAAHNFDTNGFQQGSCLDNSLSIWIGLNSKEQALDQDREKTFERVLTHELLHTFGLPSSHSWPCGDGSVPDAADQCDISNWPTRLLGWTDSDGDGIPEIIDPTPYGIANP